jgi:hypothetical protein
MDEILTDLSEPALVQAIEGNLTAFLRDQGRSPEVEWHEETGLSWYVTGIGYHNFNRIVRAQFGTGDTERRIDEALSPFQSRGVPMIWHTGPGTLPVDLEARLPGFGLEFTHSEPGMAVDLAQLPEAVPVVKGLQIERISSLQAVQEWCRIAVRSFGMPSWVAEPLTKIEDSLGLERPRAWRRLYLGRLADHAVATSLLFLGAGVAGLYSVTAIPEARRKGIGEAMTLLPLLEARSMGYRIGVLHASALGLGIYLRLGFRELCRLSRYVWRP